MKSKRSVQKKIIQTKRKGTNMKIAKVLKPRLVRRPSGKKIDFQLYAPDAQKVTLAGDFNSWNDRSAPMKKGRNGMWKTDMNLEPGRYEYKFVVDGQWWTDPANAHTSTDSMGSVNSVIEVGG